VEILSFLGEINEVDKTNGVRMYFDETVANRKNSLSVVTQFLQLKAIQGTLKISEGIKRVTYELPVSSTHGSQRARIPSTDSGS
jgi:hypothetical protein